MEKVLNVGIGGKKFTLEEDAYARLNDFLEVYKEKTGEDTRAKAMEEVESRIAEILDGTLPAGQEVVTTALVDAAISRVGLPDGTRYAPDPAEGAPVRKKLFRNTDRRVFGGVCAGLACLFNISVVWIRLIFVLMFLILSSGFWIYVILWIIIPSARYPEDKCLMYGLPPTERNLRSFERKRR
ncbi:MAG TPA: PspC domain-containing protein [Candidatus Coprenecus pullistercoris]|nr:PspC domain-containing protein [Candidatus Coprenecus pullistercoris]